MKRLFTLAAAVLTAVWLTACSAAVGGNSSKPNGLGSPFQAAVCITLGELNAEGTIIRHGSGDWKVSFDSPNTLSGVELAFCGGNVDASYKGLKFSVPQTALPVKAMLLNLIAAVDDLAANEHLTGTEEDGLLKISGTLDGGDYTLSVDKDGKLAAFEMPNNKLSMTFTGVSPAGENAPAETEAQTSETA